MSVELWWNDIDRVKPKNSKKNLSQCHFVHHKSPWTDPGVNPELDGLAANHPSRGTASVFR
jgi:hypothetical protein